MYLLLSTETFSVLPVQWQYLGDLNPDCNNRQVVNLLSNPMEQVHALALQLRCTC
jgi:hypothetical protein